MLGLVLVSLVFVQLTGAAETRLLAPLYVLTCAAPFLVRWRENWLYRLLWNLGVLGVFALLVRHAGSNNLRYVLEDGLLLAGLCQVHLLNNLRSDQRPDLLFFNAFLIASVTGFLSRDLGFALAFLFFAPLFVMGLQLQCVSRNGEELDAATTRRVARDGLWRAGVLLGATLLVFFFWPRDFKRQSLLAGEFDFAPPDGEFQVRFAEQLALDRKRRARQSGRVVLRATLLEGRPEQVPTLWRGATLGATDGVSWWPFEPDAYPTDERCDDPWEQQGKTWERVAHERMARDGSTILLSVEHEDDTERLFAPLTASKVEPDGAALRVALDGTLEWNGAGSAAAPKRYRLELAVRSEPRLGGSFEEGLLGGLGRHTALPRSREVRSATELAARLAARVPAGSPQHERVEAFRSYLEENFDYLPPGSEDAAQSLEQFLAGGAGGHCELFAGALATMLRAEGVPCRIVTGYRSAEWDSERGVLTFRSLHAHAWVEVFDPEGGWYSVDVYPDTVASSQPSAWARLQTTLTQAWNRLTHFDGEGRAAALAWTRGLPRRAWLWMRTRPLEFAVLMLGLVVAVYALRKQRLRRFPIEVRSYRRALRRVRLTPRAGETPRELFARAEASGADPSQIELLRRATSEHERSRYAV